VKETVWNQVDLAAEVVLDDLADIFALNTVSTIKADPKGKSKASAVISVLDISKSGSRPMREAEGSSVKQCWNHARSPAHVSEEDQARSIGNG
jgi:hypothetical protein